MPRKREPPSTSLNLTSMQLQSIRRPLALPLLGIAGLCFAVPLFGPDGPTDFSAYRDVVVADNGGAVRVLRNVAPKRGTWLQLDVREADGSTALGARVTLQAGGRKQLRQVQTAYSFCATNDPRVHFGVAEGASVEGIQVQWADGTIEEVGLLEPGRLHTVRRSSDR